jgi:hypothetical protein
MTSVCRLKSEFAMPHTTQFKHICSRHYQRRGNLL